MTSTPLQKSVQIMGNFKIKNEHGQLTFLIFKKKTMSNMLIVGIAVLKI